ncbi:DUF2202 domain-containing protein [Actinoplanes sp. NPDC049596]|uniref:DUF2202 domain-containing protein n=1 Tax=unclassified Actinoplanes TaxID=2626549 RepID=UPI0034266704
MRTISRRAATIAVTGLIGIGGLAVTAPAGAGILGAPVPAPSATADRGGYRMGPGYGMGSGYGNGTCRQGATGRLTAAQKTTLASVAQKEQLARDLYTAFAARYDATVFDHLAATQSGHLAMLRVLLRRYGVADPTTDQPAGTYDSLLAQGSAGLAAPRGVGRRLETDEITTLDAALAGLSAPDVEHVYTALRWMSEGQLNALTR